MEKTTITKREMYEQIKKMFTEGSEDKIIVTAEDVLAFCDKEIEALDKKAAKARERAATKKAEGDELTEAVKNALTDELEPIAIIAARVPGDEVTLHKVQYRLSALYKAGEAEKGEVKVSAEGEKSRTVVGYKRIAE